MKLKRIKYWAASILAALGFYLYLSLPFDSQIWGMMVGVVLMVFCFWFGMGIVFSPEVNLRLMVAVLPTLFYIGAGMFLALLPLGFWSQIILAGVFGVIAYVIFLVENVFLVSVGYKTVPLYRAAYTVGLILLLVSGFFLFNTMWSYRLVFWANLVISTVISTVIFWYHFKIVAIELADDGRSKNPWVYTLVPAWLVGQTALALSFWPLGIFKGSMYLVLVVYILCGLIQADLRERLFYRVILNYAWIGIAVIGGILWLSSWGGG
jgi:hypothetical protein